MDELCKTGGNGERKSQSSAEWDVVQIRRSCDVHENPEPVVSGREDNLHGEVHSDLQKNTRGHEAFL